MCTDVTFSLQSTDFSIYMIIIIIIIIIILLTINKHTLSFMNDSRVFVIVLVQYGELSIISARKTSSCKWAELYIVGMVIHTLTVISFRMFINSNRCPFAPPTLSISLLHNIEFTLLAFALCTNCTNKDTPSGQTTPIK